MPNISSNSNFEFIFLVHKFMTLLVDTHAAAASGACMRSQLVAA